MRTFKLEIALGNEAMNDAENVAIALHAVSFKIARQGLPRLGFDNLVRDHNGNTVGRYSLETNDRKTRK